jgi:hypothetical protein
MTRETFYCCDFGYILEGWLTPVSNAGRVNRLPLLQIVQSGSDAHPATYFFSVF